MYPFWISEKEAIQRGREYMALCGCSSLADVYYAGTEAQWNEIRIDSFNSEFKAATVHFECAPMPTYTKVVVLPASLTTIRSEAFAGLASMEAVSIPATVTWIAEDAFDPGVIIIAPVDSYADRWAKDRGFPVVNP